MKTWKYIALALFAFAVVACENMELPTNMLKFESNAVVTETTATLTVNLLQSSATVQTMKVHYSLSSDMSNSTMVAMKPTGESKYTVKLSNLKSGTTYHLQFEASNAYSSLKDKDRYSFTTLKEEEPYNPAIPEYVDLGLPSGIKWATFNIGATKPEEHGDYFAWGETQPKDEYDWNTYKWYDVNNNKLTKYCTNSNYGIVDNKIVLEAADDAATVNLGDKWRMPTMEELDELRTKCTWTWTTQNGASGRRVTGPNGNSIFLPVTGYYRVTSLIEPTIGIYWSSSLDYGNAEQIWVYALLFNSSDSGTWYVCSRNTGCPIRPIYSAPSTPEPEIPTELYMIGDFCNWDWADAVEMIPVHSHEGMFWCTRYMNKDAQFKFSPNRAWNGDFAQLENIEGYVVADGNGKVTEEGLYTIVVDMVNSKVSVSPANIYGIGDAFGSWEEDRHLFTVNADGTASITTTAAAELRMYTDIANVDWWQAEYMIYDGKIVYRGSDGDQERVSVDAGMTITLNFNAGTGEIASPVSATPQYVDLGLPSGIKWADRNVGASKPWEFGDYFAWGETEPKERYHQETYKYCSYYDYYGYGYHLTKYCTNGNNGTTVDNKTILEAADDAAYIHWGGEWRMPTKEERDELYENCSWEWTTQNGVEGYKLTSKKNGNSIFLLLAGCIDDTWTNSYYAFYWTSSLNIEDNWNAYDINFTKYQYLLHDDVRYYGRSIRPVYGPRPATIPAVTTYAATQITDVSAVVGGNVTSDGGASVTERGVVYSTNPEPTISNLNNFIRPCGSGTGEFTYTITNLQANTTYYLRAYARNDKGTAYGEEISFTTTSNTTSADLSDYGWKDKEAMFQDCMADAGVTGLPTISQLRATGNDAFMTICTPFSQNQCQAILDNEKWDWLEAYVMKVQNADANATALVAGTASAGWRYAIAAFFLEMQRTSWPKSADFSQAGKVEVFLPFLIQYYEDLSAGMEKGRAYVDLGLSVKWATCNVGAESPEEYGDYFAWGETTSKSTYNWNTYKWCNGSGTTLTKYNNSSSYGTIDNKTTLELSDDAARANWGGEWRMPTDTEVTELRKQCTWTWTTQNGVYGYKVTSKSNGNSIFLPAAGLRIDGSLYDAGSGGYYWSSTGCLSSAYCLRFLSSDVVSDVFARYFGHSVRPVCP